MHWYSDTRINESVQFPRCGRIHVEELGEHGSKPKADRELREGCGKGGQNPFNEKASRRADTIALF
jgi:hypothetical protein